MQLPGRRSSIFRVMCRWDRRGDKFEGDLTKALAQRHAEHLRAAMSQAGARLLVGMIGPWYNACLLSSEHGRNFLFLIRDWTQWIKAWERRWCNWRTPFCGEDKFEFASTNKEEWCLIFLMAVDSPAVKQKAWDQKQRALVAKESKGRLLCWQWGAKIVIPLSSEISFKYQQHDGSTARGTG